VQALELELAPVPAELALRPLALLRLLEQHQQLLVVTAQKARPQAAYRRNKRPMQDIAMWLLHGARSLLSLLLRA
jgi:hypothetical protein